MTLKTTTMWSAGAAAGLYILGSMVGYTETGARVDLGAVDFDAKSFTSFLTALIALAPPSIQLVLTQGKNVLSYLLGLLKRGGVAPIPAQGGVNPELYSSVIQLGQHFSATDDEEGVKSATEMFGKLLEDEVDWRKPVPEQEDKDAAKS